MYRVSPKDRAEFILIFVLKPVVKPLLKLSKPVENRPKVSGGLLSGKRVSCCSAILSRRHICLNNEYFCQPFNFPS